MANGFPIITTNRCVAGLELVKDGVNGYMVSVDDATILTDKINNLVGDKEIIKRMGEESLRLISSHTIEKMTHIHI